MMVNAYIIPAALALLVKIWILSVSGKGARDHRYFVALIAVFCLLNLAECAVLMKFQHGDSANWVIKSYYVSSICCLALLCLYAAHIGRKKILLVGKPILLGVTIALCAFVFFTDIILAGSESIGYSYTARKGELYNAYPIFVVSSFFFVFCVLLHGGRSAKDARTKVQCYYTLFALTPILVSGVFIAIVMSLGIKINAVGILPIATTLFLYITLKTETKHTVTDIRRFLPFSHEHKMATEILEIASMYSMDQIGLMEFKKRIEKVGAELKYEQSGRSAGKAAKMANINTGTYYAMLHRTGIWAESKTRNS